MITAQVTTTPRMRSGLFVLFYFQDKDNTHNNTHNRGVLDEDLINITDFDLSPENVDEAHEGGGGNDSCIQAQTIKIDFTFKLYKYN